MDETNEYTITLWVKTESLGNVDLIRKGDYYYPFGIMIESGYARNRTRTDNSVKYLASNAAITQNQGYHVAVTYKSGERKIYLNGTLDKTDATTGTLTIQPSKTTIGGWTTVGNNFKGLIDDVRIYNTALAGAEIQAIYQGTTTECVDNAALLNYVLHWKQGSLTMPVLMQKMALWKAGTGC